MQPKDLTLGDIIIYSDSLQIPEHVAMYTGHKNNLAYVTHQITYNETFGLRQTVLKPLLDTDITAGIQIHVFRPANRLLGRLATQIIKGWLNNHIPYDHKRANIMFNITEEIFGKVPKDETGKVPEDKKRAALLNYLEGEADQLFFQRIKFAARRSCMPIKTLAPELYNNSEPRGLHCVQVVILAYQVAELMSYVKTMNEVQKEQQEPVWISDKHTADKILEPMYQLTPSYQDYIKKIRSQHQYSILKIQKSLLTSYENCRPSTVAWRYDKQPSIEAFRDNFNSVLNLPANITSPIGLYWYLLKYQQHWHYKQTLDLTALPTVFSEIAKQKYRITSNIDNLLNRNLYQAACRSPEMQYFASKKGTQKNKRTNYNNNTTEKKPVLASRSYSV